MVSVAPASRRLLALSWNSKTAGKMPALPLHGRIKLNLSAKGEPK